MRPNPVHDVRDERVVRRLIEENPWATLVSTGPGGLVASHYPVLLDQQAQGLELLTHVGRPDEELHGFGEGREMLVIAAGPHGYISPGWYSDGATRLPTWNFCVAHLHAVPRILGEQENLEVLGRLVEHFERRLAEPVPFDAESARRIARGTVGLRIPVTRFECKVKMSLDKDPESRAGVLRELEGEGPYANRALAAEMARALSEAG